MIWNHNTQYVAIDTETFGIKRSDEPYAVSMCDDQGNTLLFEWKINPFKRRIVRNKQFKDDLKTIQKLCRRKQLVFHNIAFDVQKLELIGCKLRWRHVSHDTKVLWHILDSEFSASAHGRLKDLADYFLHYPVDDMTDLRKATTAARKVTVKENLDWSLSESGTGSDHLAPDYWVPKTVACKLKYEADHPWHNLLPQYALADAERTMGLFLLAQQLIKERESDKLLNSIIERENALMYCLYDMQQIGIGVKPQKIKSEIKRYTSSQQLAIRRMQIITGDRNFNVNSPIDIGRVLFHQLKFPRNLTEETKSSTSDKPKYRTDVHVRENLNEWAEDHESNKPLHKKRLQFLEHWNSYKKCNASVGYLHQYYNQLHGNVLHCSLNQNGTATTRMSSSNPNGQNIKKPDHEKNIEGLRNIFGPHTGRIWYCFDYSQLQLRIFAYLTQEQSMIDAFDAGYDFHGFIAAKIFKKEIDQVTKSERRIGKNVNFGFIFGASPAKIELSAGVSGLWNTVCSMFPSAHDYMESVKSQVRKLGYITTPHGYRLYVDSPHKGVNYIVQGCEGDIVKQGMVNCENYLTDKQFGSDFQMIFQIHDELIFDAAAISKSWTKVVHHVRRLMEKPGKDIGMVTPVDMEFTTTDWEHGQKFNWE